MTPRVTPETSVPDGETAARCSHCDRPFRSKQLRDLHVGSAHEEACTERERERYGAARDEEGDDLFLFHLKVIGSLVTLYAVLIVVYMVVLAY